MPIGIRRARAFRVIRSRLCGYDFSDELSFGDIVYLLSDDPQPTTWSAGLFIVRKRRCNGERIIVHRGILHEIEPTELRRRNLLPRTYRSYALSSPSMPCSTAARRLSEYFATEQAEQQAEYQALLEMQYSQQAQHEAILAIRDMEQAHFAAQQMSQMQNSWMWQQTLATASNGNMVADLAIANSRIDGWRLDPYTGERIYNY